jgi:hypothetical protein
VRARDLRRPDAAFRRLWGRLLAIEDWRPWVLAPEAMNYDQAEDWAAKHGARRVIALSSGDTLAEVVLVEVSENFTGETECPE